ncbi:uncharacterized protein LOC131426886, partial [Malaya genurostris]|uniref:uncharacterized protein LOC131426886 n=1 Tax=Malaya genurostris TaxID=325434 RepID=UPI0026F3F94F
NKFNIVLQLTVCGFPSLDDCSFRFRAGLIVHCLDNPKTVLIDEILRWFIYCREARDFRLPTELASQNSYVELRIRSDGNHEAFREYRSKKRSVDANLICLQRTFCKPHSVMVNGRFRIRFEQFLCEMEQIGFNFQTKNFPSLNVIGYNEMLQWITPARNLWAIVRESLEIEAFRSHKRRDQAFKNIQRHKLNSTQIYDFRQKIEELNEKIDGTKMFQKLEKNINMMAGNIAKKELNIYQQILNDYESKLTEIVHENEKIENEMTALSLKLDEEASVIPEFYDVMIASIEHDLLDSTDCKENLKCSGFLFDETNNLNYRIKEILDKIQLSINDILIQNKLIDELNVGMSRTECEIELTENCLHLCCLTEHSDEDIEDYRKSLMDLVEKSKFASKHYEVSVTSLESLIARAKNSLMMPRISAQRNNMIRKGAKLTNELHETAQALLKSRLLTLNLRRKLSHNRSIILNNSKSVSLSYEMIRGAAEILNFLKTTNDPDLNSNFVGFVYEFMKFAEPAVNASAIPYLIDFLPIAVFRKQDLMLKLVKKLPVTVCYTILAIDAIPIDSSSPAPDYDDNDCCCLVDHLINSPIQPVLVHLLKSYYISEEAADEPGTEPVRDIKIIYLNDNALFNESGCLTSGYVPSGDTLVEMLKDSVNLSLESIGIERDLGTLKDAIEEYETRMSRIRMELVAVGEDSYERFEELHQSYGDWFTLPANLQLLNDQRKASIRIECQLASWNSLHDLITKVEFQDIASYERILDDQQASLAAMKQNLHRNEVTYSKKLIDLKDELRALRELVLHAKALRHFSMFPELNQQLVQVWSNFGKDLHEKLNLLQIETADLDRFTLLNKLDQLERESIESQYELLTFHNRLREIDGFYQELCNQLKGTQVNVKHLEKTSQKGDLGRLYRYKKQLYDKNTQPAYKEYQIAGMKFKLQLLYEDERLANAYRTLHLSNMTLPCIEKLIVIKLRMITQIMSGMPAFLREPGTLRLNFQYEDSDPASDDRSKHDIFSINNTVGLSVDFVNDEQTVIGSSTESVLAMAHLLFFTSLLSVEGCKLLLLQDCLVDLDEESQQKIIILLGVLSRNMQIFVNTKSTQ